MDGGKGDGGVLESRVGRGMARSGRSKCLIGEWPIDYGN